jgi:hypothetical protein
MLRSLMTVGGLLVCVAAGCARDERDFGTPRVFGPGTAQQQQTRAIRYDPYPENEPGPKLTGVRPREYDKPIPEVDRSRWQMPREPSP